MFALKMTTTILIIFTILFCSITVSAVQRNNAGGGGEQGYSASASGNVIERVTGLVKEISGNTLVMEDNRSYNLSGVNITYKTSNRQSKGKKVAELMFLNKQLIEVVIH